MPQLHNHNSSLQPYSRKSELTWSEEREGVEAVLQHVCMESSDMTWELSVGAVLEGRTQNNTVFFMEVATERIG